MCSIKFLIRQPWAYIVAGLALLVLMLFAIFNANHAPQITAFDDLQVQTGQLVQSRVLSAEQTNGLQQYDLTVVLADGGQKVWRVLLENPIENNAKIMAYVDGPGYGTVYHLVANGQVAVRYADQLILASEKAQAAKAMMTHPISILFIVFLIGAGVLGQVFKKRQCAIYQRYSMQATNFM